MPADSGAGIVACQKYVAEIVWFHAREISSLGPQRREPCRDRLRAGEARIVEIVAPAEAVRLAVAEPAVEAERREIELRQLLDQRPLFAFGNQLFAIVEAGD